MEEGSARLGEVMDLRRADGDWGEWGITERDVMSLSESLDESDFFVTRDAPCQD